MDIEQYHFSNSAAAGRSRERPHWRASSTSPHESLVDALIDLSVRRPLDIAFTFLVDGEREEQNLTFRQLDLGARSIAAHLRRTMPFQSRVGLSFESGLDYIIALVGCFYAGVVAVPIYPPDPLRWTRTVSRMQAILDDAQTNVVLTTGDEAARVEGIRPGTTVIATDRLVDQETTSVFGDDHFDRPAFSGINRDTLALLQYTSGSTGTPKGVMLTHENLMFNFEHVRKFDEPDAVAVSWLPMYHDMGLIGLVLQVLQSGRRTVLMSPLSFIKRPLRWLQAISRYRAYATSGPSFAYELCVRKVDLAECAGMDLSCWTLAVNGAEPVRAETLHRFADKFAPLGFRLESFYPSYGLAEATLIVSGGIKSAVPVVKCFNAAALDRGQAIAVSADNPGGRTLVGCGSTVTNQRLEIVDLESAQCCSDDRVGEIWVSGPGVAQGYWNNPEASRQTFGARTDDGDGPFLRTGDLGFLHRGELFVTGRLKDLIIIRGRNHYPQELEWTIEQCLPSNHAGPGVTFSVDVDGEERLVVVQSLVRQKKLDLPSVLTEIRRSLLHEHEVAPHEIILVGGGQIPHTSSGKVQRRKCRDHYLTEKLAVAARWTEGAAPSQSNSNRTIVPVASPAKPGFAATIEQDELRVLESILPLLGELKSGQVSPQTNAETMLFADLGLESIDVAVLTELIERHYQRRFPFFEFMADLGRRKRRDVSLGELARFVMGCLSNASD